MTDDSATAAIIDSDTHGLGLSESYLEASSTMPLYDSAARHQPLSRAERSCSRSSASSSASGYDDRTFSRRDSVSSSSSLSSMPPWNVQNHAALPTTHNLGYDLPCEFGFLGCQVHYNFPDIEAWIAHSVTHFGSQPPPPKSVCIYCESIAGTFETDGSTRVRQWVWRDRMMHINDHLSALAPTEFMKPDFFLIDYMKRIDLINQAAYDHAVEYSERPICDGLLPLGSKVPNTNRRKLEREEHDLQKEKRQMRKEKDKGHKKSSQKKGYTYQD